MTLLFPFRPDWSTAPKVVRTFKTDIITSRSGKEQRRALRNRPRKSLEFGISEFGDRVRLFAQKMAKQGATSVYVADPSRGVTMTAPLGHGNTAVGISDTSQLWLANKVVLAFDTQMEVRTVSSAISSTLTFSDTSALDWPVGTEIHPALLGRLAQSIQSTRPSDGTIQATVSIDVVPLSELEIDPGGAPVTYNGREVFLTPPNWGSSFNVEFRHPFETVDYGMGAVEYFKPITFGAIAEQATWLTLTSADMAAIEDVFLRAKGQRGEFYMPTWVNDLPPKQAEVSSSTSFKVAGTDVADAYAGDTVFKTVAVFFNDGSHLFAKVASIDTSGGDSVIHLTAALGRDLVGVATISWMPVRRFLSDGMTTEWISNTVAQCQLNMVSLEDLAPE